MGDLKKNLDGFKVHLFRLKTVSLKTLFVAVETDFYVGIEVSVKLYHTVT